jgi:hypothetical protein
MPASVDLTGIRNAQALLGKRAADVEKTIKRARATLARRITVEARRDIQTEYTLSATRIRGALTVRGNGDAIELTASGRGVTLINFRNTGGQRNRPVRAEIRKGEGLEEYGDRFKARGLNGALLIFERSARPKRRMTAGVNKGQLKQPLVAEYGPSVAQMLRRPDRRERLARFAQQILATEIDRLTR